LQVMRLIEQNPEMLFCQVTETVGISNSSAYCVSTALVEEGSIKLGNCKNNPSEGH